MKHNLYSQYRRVAKKEKQKNIDCVTRHKIDSLI